MNFQIKYRIKFWLKLRKDIMFSQTKNQRLSARWELSPNQIQTKYDLFMIAVDPLT